MRNGHTVRSHRPRRDHIDLQGNLVAQLSKQPEFQVVYHLRGLTGWSTVSANGSKKLGLVNFAPESRLPFVYISSIYRETTKWVQTIKPLFRETAFASSFWIARALFLRFFHDFRVYFVCKHCVRYRCVSSRLPETVLAVICFATVSQNTFLPRTWAISVLFKQPNT